MKVCGISDGRGTKPRGETEQRLFITQLCLTYYTKARRGAQYNDTIDQSITRGVSSTVIPIPTISGRFTFYTC